MKKKVLHFWSVPTLFETKSKLSIELQFVFRCIYLKRVDWRPPFGRSQCRDRAEIWTRVCKHISSSGSRREFCRLWTWTGCWPVLCWYALLRLHDFCLFLLKNKSCEMFEFGSKLNPFFGELSFIFGNLQLRISDMNTDRPLIPSPLTGGVIVDTLLLLSV